MAKIYMSNEQEFWKERDLLPAGANYSTLFHIHADANKPRQTMLGFGAALTGASCYVLHHAAPEIRDTILRDLFSAEGACFNLARVCVGSSDYAYSCYCYDEVPGDVTMEHFSIAPDMDYVVPVLQAARRVNPDMKLYSSPWSPPGWMKTGGSMCGGWLREQYIDAFVLYYLRFLQAYRDLGLPMYALTPQNEAETDQISLMPASLLHPEYEMAFVKKIKPLLAENGLDTKIWILDHNYALYHRVSWMLSEDEAFRDAVDGVAFHYYEGNAEMMTRVRGKEDLEFHITEGGPDPTDYDSGIGRYGETVIEAIRSGASSVTAWNAVLYEDGTPNIGPFGCLGLVTLDRERQTITYSSYYKVLAHFARVLQPGAQYIETTRESYGMGDPILHKRYLDAAAFRNPDGSLVAVLVNPTDRKSENNLCLDGTEYRVPMGPNSICTIVTDA